SQSQPFGSGDAEEQEHPGEADEEDRPGATGGQDPPVEDHGDTHDHSHSGMEAGDEHRHQWGGEGEPDPEDDDEVVGLPSLAFGSEVAERHNAQDDGPGQGHQGGRIAVGPARVRFAHDRESMKRGQSVGVSIDLMSSANRAGRSKLARCPAPSKTSLSLYGARTISNHSPAGSARPLGSCSPITW